MANGCHFFSGCLGGCAGVFVGHPFDLVKVRLVSQHGSKPLYNGTYDCLVKVIRKESFFGLYKGVTSPLYSLAAINAIVFGVHGTVIKHLPDSLSSQFLAGACAGFIQSFICGPMELAKCRLQLQGEGERIRSKNSHSGTFDCLRSMYNSGGIKSISRGMNATIIREVPAFGSYFLTFAWFIKTFCAQGENNCPASVLLMAGGFAGCAAWIVTYPVDVIKTRFQSDGRITRDGIVYKYSGYRDCLRKSIAEEGYTILARGLSPTLLRAFPVNAATFTVYEYSMKFCKSAGEAQYETAASVATLD